MRESLEGWSIVLVGYWNPMIFQPAWVTGHLTQSQDIIMEVPVENFSRPPRLSFDGLYLQVNQRRLFLAPQHSDDASLNRMQEVATTILERLSHTPVSAVGVNFQFVEEEPEGLLVDAFRLADSAPLSDARFEVRSTLIKRTVRLGDQVLNFTITFREDDKVVVDFNFHRDTPNAEDAMHYLRTGVLRLREQAFDVLRTIYNANL